VNVSAAPLIFTWAPPRRRIRALIFFLIASFVLHAVCFYVFQIVYPPTVALMPAPARVSIISPDNSESVAFLRWVEAEDPALATTTQRAPASKSVELPPMQHVASYTTTEPNLKKLAPVAPDLSVPSSAAIGAVRIPRTGASAIVGSLTHKTSVYFAEPMEEFDTSVLPEFTFRASRAGAPANARFRIAIDASGTIRFCFLIESSGDPALDEQARSFLQLCRFTRKENKHPFPDLLWSVATILWGNDIGAPPANTSSSVPP
jgi:TonB family protein